MTTDLADLVPSIYEELNALTERGRPADYIPALAAVDPAHYGFAVETLDGRSYSAGSADEPFSIQSISKVFTLAMVINTIGPELWKRVGREASGNPFNSLVQLESENGIPRNPLINAGALVVTDHLVSRCDEPVAELKDFMRELSGNPEVTCDEVVAESECSTGSRNAALVYFMKSFGNIENDVDSVLDAYFHQCSLAMSCVDLARAIRFLANSGVDPASGKAVLSSERAKRVNSVMQTCGFYDESGEFGFRVGLPGKSGVGGGIVAVLPGAMTVCVWSPGLNEAGNSLLGMKTLELLTTRLGRSIF